MQFLGADAHLRAETKLSSIGEPGRGVPINHRRINFPQKLAGVSFVAGHNRFRIFSGVTIDMFNRIFDVRNHANRDAEPQILLAPIAFFGGADAHSDGQAAGLVIAAHFYTACKQLLHDAWDVLRGDALVHQQLLRGIAHRRTLRLGIDHDRVGHFKIGGLIDEDVAVPCTGLDYRNGRVVRDIGNQARTAAGYEHVHQPARLDQFVHGIARARIEQFDCARRNSVHAVQDFHQLLIAVDGFLAAAQHDSVSRLKD